MAKFTRWGAAVLLFATAATASPRVPLIEVDVNGEALQSQSKPELFLEQGTDGRILAFVFGEQWPGPCSPTQCSSSYAATYYQIQQREADGCGDVTYVAPTPRESTSGELRVIDHRARRCAWDRSYRWEVRLSEGAGTRYFQGN